MAYQKAEKDTLNDVFFSIILSFMSIDWPFLALTFHILLPRSSCPDSCQQGLPMANFKQWKLQKFVLILLMQSLFSCIQSLVNAGLLSNIDQTWLKHLRETALLSAGEPFLQSEWCVAIDLIARTFCSESLASRESFEGRLLECSKGWTLVM